MVKGYSRFRRRQELFFILEWVIMEYVYILKKNDPGWGGGKEVGGGEGRRGRGKVRKREREKKEEERKRN